LLNTTGSNNVAIGGSALLNNTASNNTAVGFEAGFSNTTGDGNVMMGYRAGNTISVGANNVIIGNDADASDGYANSIIGAFCNGGGGSTVVGYNSNDTFGGSVVLGNAAASTAVNQFVVGSAANNAGAVTTEVVVSDATWTVRINGVQYKILLKA
jgi:hypothetical protein